MALEKRISRSVFTMDTDSDGNIARIRETDIVDVIDDGRVVSTYEETTEYAAMDKTASAAVNDALAAAGARLTLATAAAAGVIIAEPPVDATPLAVAEVVR
jgi:hypothetical protein